MQSSIQRMVSDGTLQFIDLAINYIDKVNVRVYVDDVPIGAPGSGTPYTYEWITDTRIKITPVVLLAGIVVLRRLTPTSKMYHVYDDGATFNDFTMDENFKQLLFIGQEAIDGGVATDFYSDINIHGYRIKASADGIEPTDLVTVRQYQADANGAFVSRTAAEAAAAAALVSQNTATAAATAAGNSQTAAAASAAAALSSQNAAASSAGAASTGANNAQASAAAAAASYDSFDDRYLGPKAVDPTLDNDGATLLEGALYWNNIVKEMRIYNGVAWDAAYLPVGAYVTEDDLANATDPANGAGMVGFLGGDIKAALMARKILPVEVLATKYGMPLNNVGAIINSAWGEGIGVFLGPQVYTSSTTILLRNGALLIGHGSGVSGIKSANGFAGNMIDTVNFAALQAAQSVSVNDPTNPVPHGFVLSGFFLDGNVLNYSGTVSSTNGFGIRIYGRGYTIKDVRLNRIPGVGFYSELAASGTYYSPDPEESKPFNPLDEYGGIGIQGLYIYDTGEEGFVFAGPADIQVNDLYVGWPAGSYRNATYNALKTSKLFPSRTVDAALFLRSCEVGFVHAFDNRNGYGIYVDRLGTGQPAVRFNAAYVMGENCFGNIYFGPSMRYQIGILDSHNNTGGDGSRPHLDIRSAFGGVCDNVKVKKEAYYLSEYACDVARLTGAKQKLKIFIETTAGQTAGRGVLCACPISDIEVLGSALSGTPQSGGANSYLVEVTSAFTSSRLKVIGQLCDGAVNFASSPSGDYNSMFQIVSDRCINVANGISSLQRRQTAAIDISHIPTSGATPLRNRGTFTTNVNLTSTLEQTLVLGHFLAAAPQISNCHAYIVNPVGTMPNMEYAVVSAIDASTITVKIKFSAGGTGTATLMVDAAI